MAVVNAVAMEAEMVQAVNVMAQDVDRCVRVPRLAVQDSLVYNLAGPPGRAQP